MTFLSLLLCIISFEYATARLFVFGGSARISQLSNWLNADYPCQGDSIIFEDNKKTVTFLDESVQVTSIILPQVGNLIFSDDSVLGEKSRWQCTRRKSPEKVFFQSNSVFAAFSDPASWLLDQRPLLHMNQVPGAKDDVMFRDMGAFQIFIDDQVTVNTLRLSQDWPMTTQSFTQFVRTIEGQNQVELGHALGRQSSEGNISRILPLKDPIVILNKNNAGNYNPNLKNKTLSLICRYIQCPFLDRNCSTTVRPLGHCCDICGAVVTFASNKFTVNDIAEVVRDVVEDRNLNGLIQYSIERIDTEDDDEVLPRYQIVAFPLSAYDDTVFATFTLALHYKLTSLRGNLMEYFSAEYKWSELDHSYSTASKIAGLVTFCLLVLIAVAVSSKSNTYEDRNNFSTVQVVWHQGKEDDDVVQLLNPVEDNVSEEEEDTTSLFVETVKPTLFQADKYNVTAGSVVEGLSAVEMQLIR